MSDPIELHFWPTPNGFKISIALEEMGLPYQLRPVNIGAGEQFRPEFLAISPNNRMPAIVDPVGPGGERPWPEPFHSDLEARKGLAYQLVEGIALLGAVDWQAKGLQDPQDKRSIKADAPLQAVFCKPSATMFEIAGILGKHLA